MKPLEYVPIERIIENVRRDFDLVDQINMSDVIEWTFYAMGLIGADIVMIQKTTDGNEDLGHLPPVKIENYRGQLPSGIYKLIQVREYTTGKAMRASQGSFITSNEQFNSLGKQDLSYIINNSYIFTSFEEGYVEISYHSFPVDSRNYPVVPDDVKYIKAVESYIIERLARREYINNRLPQEKYRLLEQEWLWYCGSAKNSINSRSIDEMESMKNELARFFKRANLHDSSYASFGQKEQISFGAKHREVGTYIESVREKPTEPVEPVPPLLPEIHSWSNLICTQEVEETLSVRWSNKVCVQVEQLIMAPGINILAGWSNPVCVQEFEEGPITFTAGWQTSVCIQEDDSEVGLPPTTVASWETIICVQEDIAVDDVIVSMWTNPICVKEEGDTTIKAKWNNFICVKENVADEVYARWYNSICELVSDEVSDPEPNPEDPVLVSEIIISGENQVEEGEDIQLFATVSPSNADDKTVSWSVINNTGQASINISTGLLTGILEGSVIVIASANDGSGVTNSYNINVFGEVAPPAEPVGDSNVVYGRLYNHYAAMDDNIAPHGYRVATLDDWLLLNTILIPNQIQSVKGDRDSTLSHPRWSSNEGTNTSGLSIYGGGGRFGSIFTGLTSNGGFWLPQLHPSTSNGSEIAFYASIVSGSIANSPLERNRGRSIRCVRESLDGWVEGQKVADLDGNIYDTVKIGDGENARVWLVQSLATTKLRNGVNIPHLISNTEFSQITSPAYCNYDHTESYSLTSL